MIDTSKRNRIVEEHLRKRGLLNYCNKPEVIWAVREAAEHLTNEILKDAGSELRIDN